MKEVSKKILEKYFEDVKKGIKTFEVRKDEDDIQVGDILLLEEWKEGDIFTSGYTGRCIRKRVKYVLRDIPQYGLQEGYCIIGLEDINIGWIPCSERLPEVETTVLIHAKRKYRDGGFKDIITTAMYEDGTMLENDSKWRWEDIEGEWDEENDCYIIPEGWWEDKKYNEDGELNHTVDDVVLAWQPLPEPYKAEEPQWKKAMMNTFLNRK